MELAADFTAGPVYVIGGGRSVFIYGFGACDFAVDDLGGAGSKISGCRDLDHGSDVCGDFDLRRVLL